MKFIIFTLLAAIIIGLIPASTLYMAGSHTRNETSVVRDTQLLLSLKGFYLGTMNGSCDSETLHAIESYANTLTKSSLPIECSVSLLDRLKSDLHTTLIRTASSSPKPAAATAPLNIIQSEIADIRSRLDNTNTAVKGLNDGFSSYFATQFQSLTQMGVSSFATAISILIAFFALIGNNVIKDAVRLTHEQELSKAQTKLNDLTGAASKEVSAKIYTMFGAHCINLYKDLPDPFGARKPLYVSYLDIAVHMSEYGYSNAIDMCDLLKKRKEQLSQTQEDVVTSCLNNYVFYLAQRGKQSDKIKLGELLPELRAKLAEHGMKPDWWSYKDTLMWAELHLDNTKARQTRRSLDELFADPTIPQEWKDRTRLRYIFHDECPDHVERVFVEANPRVPGNGTTIGTPTVV